MKVIEVQYISRDCEETENVAFYMYLLRLGLKCVIRLIEEYIPAILLFSLCILNLK